MSTRRPSMRFAFAFLGALAPAFVAPAPASAFPEVDGGAARIEVADAAPANDVLVVRVPEAPQGSIREGRARRRGASPVSGAILLVLLIGGMGYYIVKRIRR